MSASLNIKPDRGFSRGLASRECMLLVFMLASLPASAQHAGHAHHEPKQPSVPVTRAAVDEENPPRAPLPDFIQAPTAQDRADAFPDLHGMDMSAHMREDPWLTHLRVDQLERGLGTHAGTSWELHGWTGKTRDRLWLRSHGERKAHGSHGNVELMWGHATGPWWDRMIGLRRDFSGSRQRDWLGIGVHGHTPYKADLDATAYLGSRGRAMLDAKVRYDVLLSNRLVLQPELGVVVHARDDAAMGNGRGLSQSSGGLRLRYEFAREFAPYLGWRFARAHGRTAEMRRRHGEAVHERVWVAGVRFWF